MQLIEKLNKLKSISLAEFIVILLCISLSISLLSSGIARNLFYFSVYFSLIGLCLNYKKINKVNLMIFSSIFLFGFSKIIWALIVNNDVESISYYPYFSTGKKIVLASVIVLFLVSNLQKNHDLNSKIKTLLISGFIFSTCYGIWQHFNGAPRVEFGWDRATISAYCYSALSLAVTGGLIKKSRSLFLTAIMILSFIISYFVIIFTGTRAAIIMHPLIFLALLLFSKKYKTILTIILLLAVLIPAFYSSIFESKIHKTNTEIYTFMSSAGNKMTSLGSRFSMWDEGIWFIKQKPLGASFEVRENMIKKHVMENKKNESALGYIDVHLHNEVIDTVSLQGVIGGILLLFFYICILFESLIKRKLILLSCIVCLIIYGTTDVIFFSSEATIFFMSLMVMGLFYKTNHKT